MATEMGPLQRAHRKRSSQTRSDEACVASVAPIEPDGGLRHEEGVLVYEGASREGGVKRRGEDAEEVERRGRRDVVPDNAP